MLLALLLLLFPVITLGQTTTSDSPALQALLAEVRQLRQDLRIANVAAQRAQILIYRLNAQEASLARVSQGLENVRGRLARIDDERKQNADQIKFLENMRDRTGDTPKQKEFDDAIAGLKVRMEGPSIEEQDLQSKKVELEQELRIEQAKLGGLQDELDRLDKSLKDFYLPK
jgi:chromosome segregation ATPase